MSRSGRFWAEMISNINTIILMKLNNNNLIVITVV